MALNASIQQKISQATGDYLNLSNQALNDEDIHSIVEILKQKPSVKRLNLSRNQISNEGIIALASLEDLESLDISGNNVGPTGISSLSKHRRLKQLAISGNPLEDEGIRALFYPEAELELTDLVATECGITFKSAHLILEHASLQTLDLSNNFLGNEGVRQISHSKNLICLKLIQCGLSDLGAQFIAAHDKLHTIDLYGNDISGLGAQYLAKSSNVEELTLAGNNIRSSNCMVDFGKNKKIKKLDLSYNHLTGADLAGLSQNQTLTELNLANNHISDEGIPHLLDVSSLIHLTLSCNQITDTGATALAKNSTLQTAYLDQNPITTRALMFSFSKHKRKNPFSTQDPLDEFRFKKQNKAL